MAMPAANYGLQYQQQHLLNTRPGEASSALRNGRGGSQARRGSKKGLGLHISEGETSASLKHKTNIASELYGSEKSMEVKEWSLPQVNKANADNAGASRAFGGMSNTSNRAPTGITGN